VHDGSHWNGNGPDRPLHQWAESLRRRGAELTAREQALEARREELARRRAELERRRRALEAAMPASPRPGDDPYFREARRRMTADQRPLSYGIIAVNVALFLLDQLMGRRNLIILGAKWAPAIWSGQYYRLLTAVFLHWDIMHLLMNCYAIYLLGPFLERSLGRARFLAVYLMGGVIGSAASLLFRPDTISVGASGAVFGLFGWLLFTRWRRPLSIPPALNQWITSILILNIVITLLPGTRIDMWGHFGGLAGGFLAGFVVGLPGQPGWSVASSDGHRRREGLIALAAMALFVWWSVVPPYLR